MSYTVIHAFADLKDSKHKYEAGDTFPRSGLEVSDERIAELSGSKNKAGKPLIKKVETKKPDVVKEDGSKKTKRKKKNADRTVQGTE